MLKISPEAKSKVYDMPQNFSPDTDLLFADTPTDNLLNTHAVSSEITTLQQKANPAPQQKGFTLIELMAVVVIIAVLAMIALPAYSSYVKKAHIKAAQSDLVALSLVLENYYQRNLSYPGSYASTADITTAFSHWHPSEHIFSYSTSTTQEYTLTATGSGNLINCELSLNQKNERTATSACGIGTTW